MMETMTNIEFQNRVNIGDHIRLSDSQTYWSEFLGYKDCDSTNNLCKGCKGHIKYYSSMSDVNIGCFRHGGSVAQIEVEIKKVWLSEDDFLL